MQGRHILDQWHRVHPLPGRCGAVCRRHAPAASRRRLTPPAWSEPCLPCRLAGRSTRRAAWTSSTCPVCAAGFGGRTCTACPRGFFSRGNTTAACLRCNCPKVACRSSSCNARTGGTCTTAADSTQQLTDCTRNGRRGKCDAGACNLALCAPFACSSSQYDGKCGRGLDNGCGATLDCGCPAASACSANGTRLLGTCEAVICNSLPSGGDAVWAATCSGQAAGSSCTGICVAGFTGSPVASCGNDGAWTVSSGCAQGVIDQRAFGAGRKGAGA